MPSPGPTLFAFADPRAPQWALFALGVALTLAAAILGLLFAVEGGDDALGGLAFGLALLLGGLVATGWAIRDLRSSPEWRITKTHAVRARGAKVLRVVDLRGLPEPELIRQIRYGQEISVWVQLSRKITIVAPTLDIARAVVDVWAAANAGSPS